MTSRRILLVAFAALFAGLFGCGKSKKSVVPNIEPETTIAVTSNSTDTLRAANHLIRLHWFGTDPDGDVVAYEMRMLNGANPADSNWVRLDCALRECTDSLFTIYAPTGYTRAVLEVRAIDNQGAKDPSPAVQSFSFINRTPTVQFLSGPAANESTYASATVTWSVDDPGGDLTHLSFRVYLDGNEANYDSVYTGTTTATYTVASSRFIQNGLWKSGPRTLNVRAVDDGGLVGPAATRTWYVRSPGLADMPATSRGRILLIDNSFRTAQNNQRVDTLYSNTLVRNLPAGTFSVLRLEYNNAFRSARDLAQTFRQFDAVVWYRGYDTFAATVLTAYQDSVGAYLEHGGRFYLEGLNMFEGPGISSSIPPQMLKERFVTDYLNSSGQWKYFSQSVGDSSVVWGTRASTDIVPTQLRSSSLADSLRFSGFPTNLRAFVARDTVDVAFWAKPGSMDPPVIADQMAVVMNVRQPSGGRFMVVPFPLRDALITYASPSRLLAKLLFHPTGGLLAP